MTFKDLKVQTGTNQDNIIHTDKLGQYNKQGKIFLLNASLQTIS